MFIDLVDAGTGRSQFHDLRTNLRDESAVAGSAGGGEFRLKSAYFSHCVTDDIDQVMTGRRLRKKWHATNYPANIVVAIRDDRAPRSTAAAVLGRGLRAEAEIEIHNTFSGNHIGAPFPA
jgi:hypothetical protein